MTTLYASQMCTNQEYFCPATLFLNRYFYVAKFCRVFFVNLRSDDLQCGKVQLIHILYQFNRGNVIYFIIDGGRPSVASSDKALVRRLRGFSNSLFSDGRIPTSFVTDFLLLRERKDLFTQYNINGKMSQPGTFKVNEDIRFLAIYDGFLFSGSNEGQYKCILESECKRGGNLLRKDVTVAAVTEAADQEVFAAFTDPPPVQYESGTGQRDGKECPLTRSPYFVQLMLKVMLVDISLTLALTVTVLVHRMHVIPARRRYKIVAHLLKQKKKRALKDRTARRLRRLSFLRRRLRRIAKQSDNSSSSGTETKTTNLVTAAANRIMNGNMTGIPPITSTATHVRGFNQLKGTEA
uniref:Uncharacterized protein n=1 Tax=Parascaris univalens TaxID=6257 RepID=A0A915A0U4_PARUN